MVKTMKKIVMIVALVSAISAPVFGESVPQKQADEFSKVVEYLASEQFTPNRLEFDSMTSDAVQKLIQVAKTSRYPVALRARAVQTLALYRNDKRAGDLISALMKSVRPNNKLFPAVLVSYAEVHGEAVADEVANYTLNSRVEIRLAAVIALGRYCGQAGMEQLRSIETKEQNDTVLSRIRFYTE